MTDWLDALDFKRALSNCHTDMVGDWYRDPWGWPETDWVVSRHPEILVARLNGRGVQRVARLDVPKENFATRPAMVLDPIDRILYQALVDRASVDLIGSMSWWAFGWRLGRKKPERGSYAENGKEWDSYRTRLSWLAESYHFGLTTDIVSFFATIPVDRICEELDARIGRGAPTERLIDMLQGWARVQGRSGLPQRSMASAVLANFYLRPLDDVVQAVSFKSRLLGVQTATRWMDDIWVFGRDDGALRKSQIAIEAALRDLALNMGAAKTHVFEGDELIGATHEIEHSAVDQGLDAEEPDIGALESLVDRLMAGPETASRTSIRFAATRIRKHKLDQFVQRFVDAAPRMPHGADALSRVFRDSERWRDLEDWYIDYAGSPWATLSWSLGQLGTMFPSADPGLGRIEEHFLGQVAQVAPLQVLAVAAQRTAAWNRDEARQAVRAAAPRADHPLERRVLALAGLAAGEERNFIKTLLREFEQNQVTLQMLESTNFRVPPVKADFR